MCPHQLKPSNRHTSCPGSRAGTPVCQRANPAVAVVRYSWCRAGGFIRAAIGCVCCWAVMCCVCAGHVAAGGSLPGTNNEYTASFLKKNRKKSRRWEKHRGGGKGWNSHLRDILVCADHVWRKYPNSPGSSKTPDAHNSALNDQYRDTSELRHAKVVVKVDSTHGRNSGWHAFVRMKMCRLTY